MTNNISKLPKILTIVSGFFFKQAVLTAHFFGFSLATGMEIAMIKEYIFYSFVFRDECYTTTNTEY